MARDDTPDNGQSDASAFKFISAMQPLKNAEEFIRIFHVKTRAVVAHKDGDFVHGVVQATDFNFSGVAVTGVFDGVEQKVAEDLLQKGRIGLHGQGGAGTARSAGCVRFTNGAIRWIVALIGRASLPGTAVRIS